MTEVEEMTEDLRALQKLVEYSKEHILNAPLELDLESTEKNKTEQVFNDINRYTKFYIPNSYSGNNKLYHLYVKKFVTKRVQQIFNSPKVIIYAQIPQKLQGVTFTFNPGKYKKAVKHLFDRLTTVYLDYKSKDTTH
jgi:hypothetical protein